MSKSGFENTVKIKQGDLVTYRAIKEIASRYKEQKEFAKVYWIHAKSYLWILVEKLSSFNNLKDLENKKH